MTPDEQFWWNWAIQLAVAIGTIGTVVTALFGGWIRSKLFSPVLSVRLREPLGEKTPTHLIPPDGGEPRMEEGRTFHVTVSNPSRWQPVHQVQVFLTRIEVSGADGRPVVEWIGDVPMRWRG